MLASRQSRSSNWQIGQVGHGRKQSRRAGSENGAAWQISLGQSLASVGSPINSQRSWRDTGEGIVTFNLKDARRIIEIHDPVVGDVLDVATARAPIQSLQVPRNFVDFQALQTAHGLAIVRIADNLDVTTGADSVVVTRQGGLTLSADNSETPHEASPSYAGTMDFAAWRGTKDYTEERKEFEAKIAMADAEDVPAARVMDSRRL